MENIYLIFVVVVVWERVTSKYRGYYWLYNQALLPVVLRDLMVLSLEIEPKWPCAKAIVLLVLFLQHQDP